VFDIFNTQAVCDTGVCRYVYIDICCMSCTTSSKFVIASLVSVLTGDCSLWWHRSGIISTVCPWTVLAGRPGGWGSIPGRGKGILPVATVSRPALGPTQPPVQWVPGVLSQGVKRRRGVTLTTQPHLVPRSWMNRSYTPLPPSASMACSGTGLLEAMNSLQWFSAMCGRRAVDFPRTGDLFLCSSLQ
jgi:hypothetical protein